MSASHRDDDSAPIAPGSPLARALDEFAVPELPAGFADRVVAAAEARPAPLPELRRSGGGAGGGSGSRRGWRMGRRIAMGVVGFGALASAAAATGLLERAGLGVPSPEKVWASITGKETVPLAAAAPAASASPSADPAPPALAPVRIKGAIDTPEELSEAFRRIDEVRQGRIEKRRELIDQRIESELARRREAGLPVPTPQEEARFRERIEQQRSRREAALSQRIETRREELRSRVENGEALSGRDILRPLEEDGRGLERRERLERLRGMTPEERRAALRRMPPEQRRALIEEWRARREQRLDPGNEAGAPEADPSPPTPELSQPGTPPPEPQR